MSESDVIEKAIDENRCPECAAPLFQVGNVIQGEGWCSNDAQHGSLDWQPVSSSQTARVMSEFIDGEFALRSPTDRSEK